MTDLERMFQDFANDVARVADGLDSEQFTRLIERIGDMLELRLGSIDETLKELTAAMRGFER